MKKTPMPTIAGVFNIAIGALNLLGVIGVIIALVVISNTAGVDAVVVPILWSVIFVLLIFGVPSLIGGIYAVQRRNWVMALIGSITSFLTWTIIGLVPLILVALSKDEFDQPSGAGGQVSK